MLALAAACTENSPNPLQTSRPEFGTGGNPGSPAYKYANYSVSNDGLTLSNSFKETGLGSFSTVEYDLSAHFSATIQCYNHGGNHVEGNPFNFDADLSSNTTQAPKNGQVTATKTLSVPNACKVASFVPHASNVVWSNIKFCWGQNTVTQGPVPLEPGDGSFTMTTGATATGGPLSGGSQTEAVGIFASPCQAGAP